MTSPVNRAFSASVFFAYHESWDAAPGLEVSAAPLALNTCRLTGDGLQFFIAATHAHLARMNWTGGRQFAWIKKGNFPADYFLIENGIRLLENSQRLRPRLPATRASYWR